MRKLFITVVVLFGAVVLLLGAGFWFREDIVRFAAGRFLAAGQISLTRLQGMQVSSTQLAFAELEFLLNESGQRLLFADFAVDYRVTSMTRAPEVNAITIGSAQLLAADSAEARADADDDATLLSEVLALLRDFPLQSVAINELTIPQHPEPLTFALQRGDNQLMAQLTGGELNLQAGFVQPDAAAAARFDVALTRSAETVGAFELTLSPMDATYEIAGTGNVDIPDMNALLGELDQAPLPFPLQAARLDWELAGSIADDFSGAFTDSTEETFVLGLQAGSSIVLPAELAAGLEPVVLEFTERAEMNISSGAGLTLSAARLPVRLTSTWREQAVNVDALLTLADCALAADAVCTLSFDGNAALGTYTLAGALDVDVADSGYHIESTGLTLGGMPDWLPAFDIAADVAIAADTVMFNTPLLLRDAAADPGITLNGNYDLASSTANVRVSLPELTFIEEGAALSTLFNTWPYTFDVLAGTLVADADLIWQAGELTGTVAAQLTEVGGFYGDFFFGGVNGALRADVDMAGALPVHTPLLTLTAAGLDVGLPMENLRLDFSLDRAGLLHIDMFSTEILDGTISGMDITYDFNRERNEVVVRFSGLQIERMLDLIEYKGIVAQGAVSGEIPLTLTPNGVEVANGVLVADAPGGSIRYLAAAAATGNTGNAGLDLMNQALANYQFESLTSGIEYSPDGELLLAMKLVGHNPEMSGGQRINLNLNISDNIPALLESLQAARRIEDFLAEQYR